MDRVDQGKLRWQFQIGSRAGVVALLAFFLSLAFPAEAQLFKGGGLFNKKTEAPRAQTEDEIGVPVPVTGRVEALKGHEVQFEIRAESKTPGATVEFLIRTFPSAGKIVSLVSKPYERNKAIVTYYADPSSSATSDAFAFAVRYRGGRYSAEMRYDIDLVDLKTEIQVPSEVDFGEVVIGSEAVREITIRNLGNGSMERQVFLAAPWHLLEPSDGKVSLGPRGARVLKVAFRPELTGETSYFLSVSRSKEGTTKLLGKGAEPFAVVGEALELTLDAESGERRGEIELLNSGTKAVKVEARASTRLQHSLDEGYLLAPGKTTGIPVALGATDTAPFDGTVQFFLENGYSKSARVFAPVVPARIEVKVANAISSEVINFGKVEAGRSTERGLIVTNRGGVGVPLEFHIPEPFRLLTNPGPQLGPLSEVSISIGVFPASPARGSVDVTMNIYANEQTHPVRLLANVVAPSGAPRRTADRAAPNLPSKTMRLGSVAANAPDSAAGAADPSPAEAMPTGIAATTSAGGGGTFPPGSDPPSRSPDGKIGSISPLGFVTQPLVERTIDPALRRPEDLSVFEADSDSVMIGWTAPRGVGPASFEVEVRGLLVDDATGRPQSVWAPYPAVKFERIDRLVKADIGKLNPASQYEFRVILTTEDGRSSPPSEAITARTELPMDWTYIYLFLGLGLLVGIGFLVAKIIRDRRPEVYQSQYVDV
ncbi:MAG: hypothetical protein GXX91_14980 [Verrucomicrobiaceae bacterium]|nr:hypothetical protein [Verrucomicrobiaceae bacterium]